MEKEQNFVSKLVYYRNLPFEWLAKPSKTRNGLVAFSLFMLYNAYLVGCIWRQVKQELDWEWCDGLGFLIILTGIAYACFLYFLLLKPLLGEIFNRTVIKPISKGHFSIYIFSTTIDFLPFFSKSVQFFRFLKNIF